MATFNISFQTTINAHQENRTEDTVPDSSAVAMESLPQYQAALTLWQVCPPVILLLGTLGNCMTLVILRTMPRGGSSGSMSLFFAALAVSDLALLYTGLLRQWLYRTVTLDLRTLHDVICKIHVLVIYLSRMSSTWFLVAMTMQRVVSVMLPHRVGLLSTRRKAQVRMTPEVPEFDLAAQFLRKLLPLILSKMDESMTFNKSGVWPISRCFQRV